MKSFFGVILASLMVVSLVSTTNAALVNSALIGGINDFNDDDVERLVKGDGNTGGAKIIEEGDFFEGILKFTQVNGQDTQQALFPALGAAANDYQLTAYFKLLVASIVGSDIFFGNALGDDGAGGFTHAIEVYENTDAGLGSGNRYDQTVLVADGITRATSGTLLTTLGLDSTTDDFWWAPNVPLDISVFEATEPLVSGANSFFGVSVISNPGNLAIRTVDNGGGIVTNLGPTGMLTLHDVRGTSELKNVIASEQAAGWHVRTDTTVQFVSAIPEPSSLTIFGLGIAVFGGLAWRRSRRDSSHEYVSAV